MDDRDLIPEPAVKPHHQLIGQRDLRDQDDRLSSLAQRPAHQFHINLRLAASRHPVQKAGTVCTRPLLTYFLHGLFLLDTQDHFPARICRKVHRVAHLFPGDHLHQAFFFKGLHHIPADPQQTEGLPLVGLPLLYHMLQQTDPCPVILLLPQTPELFCLFPGCPQHDDLFLLRVHPGFDRENSPQGLGHGGAIAAFHPDRQEDQPGLCRLRAVPAGTDHFDLPGFPGWISGQPDHISGHLPIALPKRHVDHHAHTDLIFQIRRDSILEYLIQVFVGDIHDNIGVQHGP